MQAASCYNNNILKRLFAASFVLIIISSCQKMQKISFTGEAQGTYYAVTYFDSDERNLHPEIDSLLKAFDQVASLWEPESMISKINRNDSTVVPDSTFINIFNIAQDVSRKTNGAFDISVGPLIKSWGFWFRDRIDMNQEILDSLMPLIGYEKVRLESGKIIKDDPRIHFDFNAIAQGYSVDLIGDYLESEGIDRYLIDIGGEVLGKGRKPGRAEWKVGIERPGGNALSERVIEAVIFLRDKALATSGSYRKFYVVDGVKYSHTVDPNTGYPVQHSLLSATVLADDCITADAYATAFMVMGLEKTKDYLEKHDDLEVFLIYAGEDGSMKTFKTSGMRKIMFE